MDDLIFKNYSLINEIKIEYEKLKKENEELKKQNDILLKKKPKNSICFARKIIKGNGGWYNFTRCNDKCVDDNYCQKHLLNLKDGDVRKIGSKNFPFYYGDYNHKPAPEDKLWVENMEKIFPNIYFQGDKILDLDKYDIHGYKLIK